MDSEDTLLYIVIGAIIWLFIMYHLIRGAVASANRGQSRHQKLLFRMKAKQMMKQGFTYQNIVDMYSKSDEEFWLELKEDADKHAQSQNN